MITISELLKLNTNNIIDIRNNYEYQLGHIKNAKSIPVNELLLSPEKYLKKEETYYLYCNSGFTSLNVVKKLNKLGYRTVNIIGGYHNYLLR